METDIADAGGNKEGRFFPLQEGTFDSRRSNSVDESSGRGGAAKEATQPEMKEDRGRRKKARWRERWARRKEETKDGPSPVPFHQLFRFATRCELALICVAVLAASVTGVCMAVLLILYGELTDVLIDHQMELDSGNSTHRRLHLLRLGDTNADQTRNLIPNAPDTFLTNVGAFSIGCATLGLIQLLSAYVFVTSLNYSAENQILRIRTLFLQSVLRQDIAWYDTHQIGDFASRVTEDLNKLKDGIGEKVGMVVMLSVSFLSNIVVSFIYGWKLTLVILSLMPLLVIATAIVGKMQASLAEKELKAYGKAGAVSEEVLGALRTVLAFGGEQKEVERFKANLTPANNAGKRRGIFLGLGNGLMWLITYVSYSIAFYYGVHLILESRGQPDPEYTAASMVIALFGVLTGATNMGQASPYLEAFSIARGAAATVYAIIDRIPDIDSLSPSGVSQSAVIGAISFEGVHFSYPSRPDVKILQGLSFKINRGETVALVGHSGCGKSTCIQLIQRLYDPLSGTVRLDGMDISSMNVSWLRSHIGVVGQEPVLFGASIADNIRYGKESATQQDIEAAAKEANAHDFIMKLPQRYDTLVGERGAQLSGGQKQRIAIARALVRKPVVLLLDEATSALDTSSEAMVQSALDKASKGRTTVIVAHRLSTIRGADKILVLSAGSLVEEGSHDQLMLRRGHYYQLVLAQLEGVPEASHKDHDDGELKNVPDGRLEEKIRRQSVLSEKSEAQSGRRSVQYAPKALHTNEEEFDEAPMARILSMNKPEMALLVSGGIGAMLVGCSMPTFAVLFGDLYGVLSLSDPEEVRSESGMYSVYFLITGIVTGTAAFLQMFSFNLAGVKLTNRLRLLSFAAMLRQEVAWFDDERNSVGALCSRLSGDAASVQGATGSRIGVMVQAFATLVLGVVLALTYDWKLGLVTATSIPIVLASVSFEGILIRTQNLNEKKALERSSKIAVEAIGNIRTVASLGLEGRFKDAYVKELIKPHISGKRKAHLRGLVFGLGQSVPFVVYAGAIYYGGYLIATEGLHYKKVIKVSEAIIYGTMMLGQALAFAPNFNQAKVSASKIFALLDRKPQITTLNVKPDPKWKVEGSIDFSEVDFEYPTRSGVRILKGLDLKVLAGKTVALVGSSGCGKSTCIQLLQRFYEPMSGSVSLDSRDISTVALETLRRQLGIVSQEPILFDLTIAENIAYGDHSRVIPMDEIIDAAKKANIHNFITSLPLGYESRLGERGAQLSGGQKQRIAIARALIRDPRILLLDEATSALDTHSEKVVQEALDKARTGRTVVTIAHRLSTVSSADVICVIKDGRVSEMGSHQKLMSLKGLYYQLHAAHGTAKGDKTEE
ncbi:multidrug resistance protein homolog 49-like [Ischnura elegans]|uniref:multidrug resistance protein homolog 49-like n=1 Tax=Ischnura elegans TaxID=197161 RepID=UPI001ED8793B|nr:multidrug resistance protein homolog 49-like [Ischnura elegans]